MSTIIDHVLDIARGWLGRNETDGSYKEILDVYNSHSPLARGYAIKMTDAWCDAFVSAVAIKAGIADLIGTEIGCEKHIDILKAKGIWIEDGIVTPRPGDIIFYNWDAFSQPNDGFADHVGIVESVNGLRFTTIEGNYQDSVCRRTVDVGWGYIRGFARPNYESVSTPEPAPAPAPQPQPVAPATPVAPPFPLGENQYFGPEASPDPNSISGYHSHREDLRLYQQQMSNRGWPITVDGLYGDMGATTPAGNTADITGQFQTEKGLKSDKLIGSITWAAAWTAPIT